MAKDDLIEFDGTIMERLPEARFRVALDNGHQTLAYTSGRLKKNRIRMLVGDRVTVEMTPYDCPSAGSRFAIRTRGLSPRRPDRIIAAGAKKHEGARAVRTPRKEFAVAKKNSAAPTVRQDARA